VRLSTSVHSDKFWLFDPSSFQVNGSRSGWSLADVTVYDVMMYDLLPPKW
jgi:hypothetical protein